MERYKLIEFQLPVSMERPGVEAQLSGGRIREVLVVDPSLELQLIVQDIVRSVLEASTYELDEPMTQTFSRIFFGAMSAAGESVTTADDPTQAVARIEAAILFILEGLKSLAEQGVVLTDPAGDEPT